jgi:hypothetical protein
MLRVDSIEFHLDITLCRFRLLLISWQTGLFSQATIFLLMRVRTTCHPLKSRPATTTTTQRGYSIKKTLILIVKSLTLLLGHRFNHKQSLVARQQLPCSCLLGG